MFRVIFLFWVVFASSAALAGPYTETGVNGYIGDDRWHADPRPLPDGDPDARINPIFRGWAADFKDYLPSDDQWSGDWDNPNKALGPATGNNFDIVSLGDLNATEIADGCEPGQITLIFGDPCNISDPNHIRNVKGYDFVVFENGFVSDSNAPGGSVAGQMFSELGYVEVSSDGDNFIRFLTVSLTPQPQGTYPYLTIEISNIYNFVGKHPNACGECIGTPFDLAELAERPDVVSGIIDINNVCYIRIVDIPGSGDFYDTAVKHTNPNTWPDYTNYDSNHPIYDTWLTWGSSGLDLEAVGVLNEQQYEGDINLDGIVDFYDLELMLYDWLGFWGEYDGWLKRSDISHPQDNIIDMRDFAVLAGQWMKKEIWRTEAEQE